MTQLTHDQLRRLIAQDTGPCVSLFMPTYRGGKEVRQNPIRFKNLLRKARSHAMLRDLNEDAAREILGPAFDLLEDPLFWQHLGDGLAVYCAPGMHRCFPLPHVLEEFLVVADRFHVKPVLPYLFGGARFYILAISQKKVRLFQATRESIRRVHLPDLPEGLEEALPQEATERQLQFRGGSGASGAQGVMVHGHAEDKEKAKDRILRYFRQVDGVLREFLNEARDPLLLAGVEYLFPIYQEANSYRYLHEEGIPGNPEGVDPQTLRARAWEILAPAYSRELEEEIGRFHALAGVGRTADRLETVVPAAHQGRVETLFVPLGVRQWGSFDPESNTVLIQEEARPGESDLYDLAAIQTILNGGKVYALDPGRLPGDTKVAAILRYG